jgi:hypothetical protein
MSLVYRFNPIRNTNEVRLKYLGNSYTDESLLKNEAIEFESDFDTVKKIGKNTFYFGKHMDYEVKGKIYLCNIGDDYILKNDKYPIMHLSIMYEKQFVTGFLFAVFINFKPNTKITNIKDIINSDIDGKFTVEFSDVDCATTKSIEKSKDIIRDRTMTKYLKDFESNENNLHELDILMGKIDNEINEQIKKMKELTKERTLDTYKKTQYLIENVFWCYTVNEQFLMLIDAGLELINLERRGDNDGNFSLPTKVISMRNVIEHPEDIEKLVKENDRSNDA